MASPGKKAVDRGRVPGSKLCLFFMLKTYFSVVLRFEFFQISFLARYNYRVFAWIQITHKALILCFSCGILFYNLFFLANLGGSGDA